MLSFSTVDNQHRQSFVATSLDEGSWSAGSGAKLNTALAALTVTAAHKSSSEVYGKIEEFMSPAV